MKVERVFTRLRLSLVACLMLIATATVLVATASAQTPGGGLPPGPEYSWDNIGFPAFNPQEINIPYLAWRGEEVRLVKCSFDIPAPSSVLPNQTPDGFFAGNRASIFIVDWSGDDHNRPQPVSDTFKIFHATSGPHEGQNCLKADFISDKPGLAIIKMSASDDAGVQQVVHTFLVGWMAVNSVAITNPGSPPAENPGFVPGNSVNAQVSGAIPLNAEFQSDWGLPNPLVLPRDWAAWARAMATTDKPTFYFNFGNQPSQYWDIHDSSGPGGDGGNPDIHVPGFCVPATSTTIDQVDNCNGPGNPAGFPFAQNFSRVFGDAGTGLGPFDPSYPATLLSDGNLNAFDAPLPPLKVVFTSTGGMGGFTNSAFNDKRCIYNRDPHVCDIWAGFGGPGATPGHPINGPHNLYAPYYATNVPATSTDYFTGDGYAAGTDSPEALLNSQCFSQPNDFYGYGWCGPYPYWQIANVLVDNSENDTICRLRDSEEGTIFRETNNFPSQVAVFSDEHGEARVTWQPGTGNDFFGTSPDAGVVDMNGGCDLEGVVFRPQVITAAARYPFENVSLDVPGAGTITKHINNLFRKTLSCIRKDNSIPGAPGQSAIAYICTVTARDIDGSGAVFNGERVCFSREPENVWYDIGGNTPHQNGYCVFLEGGTDTDPASASVETPATLQGTLVDVTANFTDEHLLRDACILVGAPASTPGPCGSTGGGGGTTTSGTTTSGTTTSGTTTSGTTTSGTTTSGTTTGGGGISTIGKSPAVRQVPAAKAKASVQSVQLVLTRNGRVLMVRIHSPNKTAKIQIRLINANGKVITRVVRIVKTNKRVQVKNLRIPNSVKTVRVKVLS